MLKTMHEINKPLTVSGVEPWTCKQSVTSDEMNRRNTPGDIYITSTNPLPLIKISRIY